MKRFFTILSVCLAFTSKVSAAEVEPTLASGVGYKLTPLNDAAKNKAIIEGTGVGGGISSILEDLKKDIKYDTKDKIVFIEGSGEAARCINAVFLQLMQVDFFRFSKAVVWGNFPSNAGDKTDYEKIKARFAERLDDWNIPVLQLIDFGCGLQNKIIPIKMLAMLKSGSNEVTLTFNANN